MNLDYFVILSSIYPPKPILIIYHIYFINPIKNNHTWTNSSYNLWNTKKKPETYQVKCSWRCTKPNKKNKDNPPCNFLIKSIRISIHTMPAPALNIWPSWYLEMSLNHASNPKLNLINSSPLSSIINFWKLSLISASPSIPIKLYRTRGGNIFPGRDNLVIILSDATWNCWKCLLPNFPKVKTKMPRHSKRNTIS